MANDKNIFHRAFDRVIEGRVRRAKVEIEIYRDLYSRAKRD